VTASCGGVWWSEPRGRERPEEALRGLDVAGGLAMDWWRRREVRRGRLMRRAASVVARAEARRGERSRRLAGELDEAAAAFARGRVDREVVERALSGLVVAAERTVGLWAHANQVAAALAIEQGAIVELATGEGKTLSAAMGAALLGWRRRGVHVVTANDYLAARDAEWAAKLLNAAGLGVASISGEASVEQRRAAHAQDVTYATSRELAADWLRERLAGAGGERGALGAWRAMVAGGSGVGASDEGVTGERALGGAGRVGVRVWGAVVDEADFVLLDDAVTPLVLSGRGDGAAGAADGGEVLDRAGPADAVAQALEPGEDFVVEGASRDVRLTGRGREKALAAERWRRAVGEAGGGASSGEVLPRDREHLVLTALRARWVYREGVEYVIEEGKVAIVDAATGRLTPDRSWRAGLHQAVEAKHGLRRTDVSRTLASVSFQRFFRLYPRLAGLTGTAASGRREFARVYRRGVVRLPTHEPNRRRVEGLRVFGGTAARDAAAVEVAVGLREAGRPVLMGCDSVERARAVSGLLGESGAEHAVLSAEEHEREAAVIAAAGGVDGGLGRVTVATPMAGRGADIKLDEAAKAAGGLAVIVLNVAGSARIERQYVGRSARQGDPGLAAPLGSLRDEVVERHGGLAARVLRAVVGEGEARGPAGPVARALVRSAQRRSERAGARARSRLLRSDEAMDTALGFARRT